jgi:hypothetical protein
MVNGALVVGPVGVATVREPAGCVAMDPVPPAKMVRFVLVGIVADATVSGVFNRRH